MLGSKRIRKNRFRKKSRKTGKGLLKAVLKFSAGAAALAALSLGLIFCHDAVTQSGFFRAATVTVSGHHRLERDAVLARAGLAPGENILAVNLAAVRKRLRSHPWIAEASVRREIPRAIHIRIEEHRPSAVLDLGRKFLVDARGIIFKELAPGEGKDLPVIRGLRFADVHIEPTDRTGASRALVYDEVIAVLRLGRAAAATLPSATVARIEVDREMGLNLQTTGPEPLEIRLGFKDYQRKFGLLERVLARLQERQTQTWQGIRQIDLNDPNRIVVRPRFSEGDS